MLVKTTVIICVATFLAAPSSAASAVEHTIPILIQPRCTEMFFGRPFVDLNGKAEKRKLPKYVPWDTSRAKPMVYKDPRNSISFYVESDGRHLAAIDPDGKLLWVRNPFEDRELCPYRTARPVIRDIKAIDISPEFAKLRERWGVNTDDRFIAIQFDSSQFGVVNETTGEFDFERQN
jgi:hypothetical protein